MDKKRVIDLLERFEKIEEEKAINTLVFIWF